MTEPLSLIVLISALATGLVTSIVSVTHLQGRQPEFFRYFLTNILLFNLLILSGLTLSFLQLRLQTAELAPHAFMLPGLLIVMAALKLGWLQVTVILLETLIIGGALLTSLKLLFTANKIRDGERRKSIQVFGAYHFCLLGIILIVAVIGWLQPGPQRLAQLLANGGFLILFNVFPLLWMKWFRPSVATVKDHNHNLFRKTGVRNRLQLSNLFR